MHRLLILSLGILILLGNIAFAQKSIPQTVDPLAQQFVLFKKATPDQSLFVHFDKTIYTNNEDVWFTGYLLNEKATDISKHNIMSVALIRNTDSAIVKHHKYLMTSGISFGSMLLPDSMLTGEYHFLVTTNRVSNGNPDVVFVQPITIKTNINPAFNASIKILSPGIMGKSPNKVLLSATTRDFRFLPKPLEVSYKYGKLSKKTKTNSSGEVMLDLNEQEGIIDPNVYVKLKYGKDSSFLNLPIPVTKRKAKVSFYPEGGNLINGLPGRISWEVKDQQLAVVTLKAQLYKDETIIDTIETNSYGIGHFSLTPEKGSVYKVKLLHSGFADSNYVLPAILDQGISIHMPQAAAKDTLIAKIRTTQAARLFIRVHNFRETFVYNSLDLKSTQTTIKIVLEDVPKGIQTLTISDSLGRPLAERLFFAHYNPAKAIAISTDEKVYGQRKKITLKINCESPGMVSIACMQDNRISSRLSSDIESYTYLSNQLNTLPPFNTRGYEDPKYIEDVLMVKGWRRYTWQAVMNAKATDTLRNYDYMNLGIQISWKKPILEPIQIGLISPNRSGIFATDNRGNYEFNLADLVVQKESPIHVFIGDKNAGKYVLKLNDPYLALNKNYLKTFGPEYRSAASSVQNNTVLSLKSNESAIRLKEVEITAGNKNDFHHPSGANRCGDYVCSFNILNCPNHRNDINNRPPVVGSTYKSGGTLIVYKECDKDRLIPGMIALDGIYSRKEFYMNDYAEPLEPAFASTLYWNNGVFLNQKEKEITFHTSDITGKFRIIIQGISPTDILYGDYSFEVKGK